MPPREWLPNADQKIGADNKIQNRNTPVSSLTTRRLPPIERTPRVTPRGPHSSIVQVRRQPNDCTELRENYDSVNGLATELLANEIKEKLMTEIINDLRDENTFLRMHTRQRDDTIAHMYRRMLMMEEQLERAEAAMHSDEQQGEIHCLCCFSKTRDFLRCNGSAAHGFCTECVNTRCRIVRDDPCTEPTRDIACMSTEECDGRVCNVQGTPDGDLMLADYYVKRSMRHIMNECPQSDDLRLCFMRADGTFRGLQCQMCGYGPLWNENCSELVTHHAQSSEAGGRIDNTCSRCGTFVHDTPLMRRWDGSSHVVPVDP